MAKRWISPEQEQRKAALRILLSGPEFMLEVSRQMTHREGLSPNERKVAEGVETIVYENPLKK